MYPFTAGLYLQRENISYLVGVATGGFPKDCKSKSPDFIMQFVSMKGISDQLAAITGKYLQLKSHTYIQHIFVLIGDCRSCPICKFIPNYDLFYCIPGRLKIQDKNHFGLQLWCPDLIKSNVIYRLVLEDQPQLLVFSIFELKRNFPDLKYLSIRKTGLSEIVPDIAYQYHDSQDAQIFYWLREINLDSNMLSDINGGVFDGMFTLKRLSLLNNTSPRLETKSWPLCYSLEKGELQIQPPNIEVIQNFNFDAPSKIEEKYCQLGKGQFYRPYGILTDFISKCNINRRVSKSTWDCSRGNLATDWYVLPCLKLIDFNFKDKLEHIIIPFSHENKEFDSVKGDNIDCRVGRHVLEDLTKYPEINRNKSQLILYGINIDLKLLIDHTSSDYTQKVTVYADRVFLSEPLKITYKLYIRARIVHLVHPILMTLPFKDFIAHRSLHFKKMTSIIYDQDTAMYHTQFGGLIDIVEEKPWTYQGKPGCIPKSESKDKRSIDPWYDDIFLKLALICLRSKVKVNPFLARKLAKTYVYLPNKSILAMRFQSLLDQTTNLDELIHPVPVSSLDSLQFFTSEMTERLKHHEDREQRKKEQIFHLSNNAVESRRDLDIMHKQMRRNFENNQKIISFIQESSSIEWETFKEVTLLTQKKFDNTMKGIVTFLDGSMNITNTMLIEDKDRLLTTAKNQVDTEEKHVEDANMNLVHIYQSQKANSDSLKLELKELDRAVKIAKENMIADSVVGGILGVLKGIGKIVLGIKTGDFGGAFEGAVDLFKDTLKLIVDALQIDKELKTIGGVSGDQFVVTFTKNLTVALESASKMTGIEKKFSEMKVQAEITYEKLRDISVVTNSAYIKKKMFSVAAAGQSLVIEVSF